MNDLRRKTYQDYGFTSKDEVKQLISFCRSVNFELHDILYVCAEASNKLVATELCCTVLKDMSYDDLSMIQTMPINKNDFYACRRLLLGNMRKCLLNLKIKY
jgi:hypothetical protein